MNYSEYRGEVSRWIEQVLENRGINAELTLKYCADIEQYAKQNDDVKLLGFSYYYSGETYYVLNDGEKLFRYIIQAISYLDESEQWDLVARAYNIVGITSVNRGNAPIAMDYYLAGLVYCKKYHLYQEGAFINLNIGSLYIMNGQPQEAQKYYENVYGYVKDKRDMDAYYNLMCCIKINLGNCYLQRGMMERVQECIDFVEKQCVPYLYHTEQLYVLCFKTRYYHATGRISQRDACIEEIHKNADEKMVIMDAFDDFYELCRLLLEIGTKDEVFWDILNILEKLAKNAKIINLQRKIVSLKIKYYRKHKDHAGYLQGAGLYYELTEVMERENRYMITNMLSVRNSLECANEKRREIERANAKLRQKSETDALTHLPNRFLLNDFSEEAFERSLLGKKSFAVEILDIDYFKEYNDNYGHQAGDACIVAIAETLKSMCSEQIFCARYGGDEFIIIYEGMSKEETFAAAERLRQQILDLALEHCYSKALPVVTVSQGICYDVPKEENKNWDFLHTADMMLYQVKKTSRNNILMGNLDGTETVTGH